MKNAKLITLLGAIILTVGFSGQALAFTDYGKDLNGHQCASPVKEDGTCNLIYSNDASLIGDSSSFNVSSSAKIAQPNREPFLTQEETRRQICLIIGC